MPTTTRKIAMNPAGLAPPIRPYYSNCVKVGAGRPSRTVYVTDMRYFDEIAAVRVKAFPRNGPASTIVEVRKLALPGLVIEIDAVAVVPDGPARPIAPAAVRGRPRRARR